MNKTQISVNLAGTVSFGGTFRPIALASRAERPLAHAGDFGPYLERGIVNDLRSGSGKSRQREIAARWRRRERFGMKTNEYRGDFESCTLPDPANEPADRSEEHRTMSNRIFARGDLPTGPVAALTGRPQFPLRTLMVCFTIWLIATQAMIFDQVKFDERAHLLEQTARSLGAPQVVVPTERPTNVPNSATTQRL